MNTCVRGESGILAELGRLTNTLDRGPIRHCAASLIFALTSFACVGLNAQEPARAETQALQQLDRLLSDTTTLTADVKQLIVESDGGVLEESEILMKIKRPNGFYWETLSPFPELIVSDGITLWHYEPDLEQVVVEDRSTFDAELAAQLLNGETASLTEDYELTLREPLQAGAERVEFQLLPKDPNSVYSSISLSFMLRALEAIYIESTNGQRTVWEFSEVIRNRELADELFVFTAPAGVEVIQNSYTQ